MVDVGPYFVTIDDRLFAYSLSIHSGLVLTDSGVNWFTRH